MTSWDEHLDTHGRHLSHPTLSWTYINASPFLIVRMQELQKINGLKDRDSDGEKLLDCVLNYMMFEKDVTG